MKYVYIILFFLTLSASIFEYLGGFSSGIWNEKINNENMTDCFKGM